MANVVSMQYHRASATATIETEDGEITLMSVPEGELGRALEAHLLQHELRAASEYPPLAA